MIRENKDRSYHSQSLFRIAAVASIATAENVWTDGEPGKGAAVYFTV
jgi:hypothetical protein